MIGVVSTHEVERVAVYARCRDELAERNRAAVGTMRDREQKALVARVEYAPERHREAAFHLTPAPLDHDVMYSLLERGVQPGRVVEGDGVAVVRDPVDRLAQALARTAFQRERPDIHDALVADVPLVHAGPAVDAEPLLTGPEHGHRPAAVVREAAKRRPELVALLGLADRVGGDEADAAVDRVRHEAIAFEECLLVAPEREVVERPGAQAAHDVGSALGGVGATTRAVPVDDGPERQHERDRRQPETDGEQGRVQERVHSRIERHGPDADQPSGGGPPGLVPGDRATAAMGRDHAPEHRCADEGDRDHAT